MLKKQYLKTKPLCKVTFSLPVDVVGETSEVRLLGDFNDWSWEKSIEMKAGKAEYVATVELETGRAYEFRYLVGGSTWINDHAADGYVPSPFPGIDNSVVSLETTPAPTPKKKATSGKAPAKKAAAKKAPVKKSAPVKATAEDLKKIEGIGPKIEKLLNEAGITTFGELAKAKKTTLKGILEAAGPRFKMHDPATWTKQATLAEKGQWEKLQALQDELKGGRPK
jgi:predicted flap endonuclease-1-like 5' DNA nuclease